MKTNLALSTTPAAKTRRAPSQAQTTQRQTVAMLGQIWRSMSFQEKSTWTAAAKQVHGANPSSATGAPRISAYLTFLQAGGTLYATTGTVPRTAALPPAYPASFGSLTLNATGAGAAFGLLIGGSNYPDHVIVRAAPPVPAGQTTYKKGAFKIIGTAPGINSALSLTAMYLAHYVAPGPGASIAIELIGVSAGGIRTAPTLYTVVTGGTGDAAADTEPALTLG